MAKKEVAPKKAAPKVEATGKSVKQKYLVRTLTDRYYANKLWRSGEEFEYVYDTRLLPPRDLVVIAKKGGEILGVPKQGGGLAPYEAPLPDDVEDALTVTEEDEQEL